MTITRDEIQHDKLTKQKSTVLNVPLNLAFVYVCCLGRPTHVASITRDQTTWQQVVRYQNSVTTIAYNER